MYFEMIFFFQSAYMRELSLDQLEPYTYYIIQGAVSNYYSKYTITSLGEATQVRTKPGGNEYKIFMNLLPKILDKVDILKMFI